MSSTAKAKSKKIIMQCPRDLVERVDQAVADLGMNRSEFFRQSAEEKVGRFEEEKLKNALRQGYIDNASYYSTALDQFNPQH